jgi:hypothetical protein
MEKVISKSTLLSKWEKFKRDFKKFANDNILLELIKAEQVKCAFKNYRNPRVRMMVVCLFIQKFLTFAYLINLQLKSEDDYIASNMSQIQFY